MSPERISPRRAVGLIDDLAELAISRYVSLLRKSFSLGAHPRDPLSEDELFGLPRGTIESAQGSEKVIGIKRGRAIKLARSPRSALEHQDEYPASAKRKEK